MPLALVAVVGLPWRTHAQRPIDIPLSPIYNGWVENSDGTSTIYFGYINRTRAGIEVPIGGENMVGDAHDLGQPTFFLPGQHHKAFALVVPGTAREDVVWSVTTDGVVQRAVAKQVSIYAIGETEEEEQLAETPVVTLEVAEMSVRLSESLSLRVLVRDHGQRRGRRRTARVLFAKYRGPQGEVTFAPETVDMAPGAGVDEPLAVETTVTFPAAGVYTVSVIGSNGRRENAVYATVTVTE